jgi:hypothetical protein
MRRCNDDGMRYDAWPLGVVFLCHLTAALTHRLAHRCCYAQVLGTSRADFLRFADACDTVKVGGRVAAVCSSNAAATASEQMGQAFTVIKPLEV